jgi:hydrogenase nickel incorporation protein HypA/HybF
MHELYLAECIIKSVRESLPETVLPQQVTDVRVEVGQLDAVVPETLLFLFDAIKSQHELSQAQLNIETIPVVCRCNQCHSDFGMELPVFVCPTCGQGDITVLKGRGIRLTGLSARDEEGETDGHSGNS